MRYLYARRHELSTKAILHKKSMPDPRPPEAARRFPEEGWFAAWGAVKSVERNEGTRLRYLQRNEIYRWPQENYRLE
jgi:hypothetical protein